MTEVTKEEVEKLVEKIAAGQPVQPIKEAPKKAVIPMKAPEEQPRPSSEEKAEEVPEKSAPEEASQEETGEPAEKKDVPPG